MKIHVVQKGFYPNRVKENFLIIRAEYKKALAGKADIMVLPGNAIIGYEADLSTSHFAAIEKLATETKGEHCAILCETFGRFFLLEKGTVSLIDGGGFEFNKYNCKVLTSFEVDESDCSSYDIVFFLEAMPFAVEFQGEYCDNILDRFKNTSLVYVNQCGGIDNVVLSGHSMIKGLSDEKVYILPDFEDCSCTFEFKKQKFTPLSKLKPYKEKLEDMEFIRDALVVGIRDYFKYAGIKKAVVGISGGIDSAVIVSLAVEALGRTNVFGVMMPSQFSTDHSVKDAVRLADNLQIYYEIIKIKPIYDTFIKQLDPLFKDTEFGLAEENMQARSRATLLMSIANKFGYLLINTSNKSEGFCGYGTLYGDLCGSISPLGDLYKSQVYELAEYINRKKEIIPQNIIDKAPSAELRVGQKDSDSLGEYDIIEKIARSYLYEYITDAKKIAKQTGIAVAHVEKIISLFQKSEFKRRQAAPAIVLTTKPLSRVGLTLN
ncbi:MAG: NAD(+) synthase [Bacteroidales bacterium]|jgi:NAD+ synthase (glutamine-hydrolysing)|nr:NAD(+) synthase [Bacteroidales bacterium]